MENDSLLPSKQRYLFEFQLSKTQKRKIFHSNNLINIYYSKN
jgi:hypothetical protein